MASSMITVQPLNVAWKELKSQQTTWAEPKLRRHKHRDDVRVVLVSSSQRSPSLEGSAMSNNVLQMEALAYLAAIYRVVHDGDPAFKSCLKAAAVSDEGKSWY